MSRRNSVAIALHLVWTTHERKPLIQSEFEAAVYACIIAESTALHCTVLAIGGMPDHVHLIILLHPTTPLSKLMQQIKGTSSHLINHVLFPEGSFRWRDGYAAFSMSRNHRDAAVLYVQNQKLHHADQTLRAHWEATSFSDD
ncbi:IS200/IS605 family transposase [Armatimonas sp.]|uniref:IS200/IS605 family transposase n=1 Tax=Armatimonas sp. TaxID=1872638 RepID=UPI00374D414D